MASFDGNQILAHLDFFRFCVIFFHSFDPDSADLFFDKAIDVCNKRCKDVFQDLSMQETFEPQLI